MNFVERLPFDLAAARRNSRLSQQELANRSGISLRQIQDLERGKVTRCRPYTVRALARALDAPLPVVVESLAEPRAASTAAQQATPPFQQSMFDTSPTSADEDEPPHFSAAGLANSHARRIRTLLLTQVLNQLQMNKTLHQGWEPYDMHALQLRAIQTVVEHMELLTGGISRLALSANLVDVARLMAPDHEAAIHHEVANQVIDWLINDKDRDVFTPCYIDFEADDTLVRRQATIELLRERQEPDGSLVLRASVEAINLLLGVLSDDVADAQRAEERLLDDFIEAGRYDAALNQAGRARLRSIQYGEQVGRWISAARQDISQLDWTGAIKHEHDKALSHVQERLSEEARMRDRVAELRRDVADLDKVEAMLRVIRLLQDCHSRHTQLHGLLMDTGPTFRYEQERQRFARPLGLARVALREALETMLNTSILSNAPGDVFFRALIGPAPTRVLDLARLAAELNAPARESTRAAVEIPELALEEGEMSGRFPDDALEACERALALVADAPRRLSALLEESRRYAPANPHLAAELTRLRALDAFAGERRNGNDGLISEKDGRVLQDSAYEGDDLLVARDVAPSPAPEALLGKEGRRTARPILVSRENV